MRPCASLTKGSWGESPDGGLSVPCDTLEAIFSRAIAPVGRHIDFMSIDVEGAELVALPTLNWTTWDVDVVVVEANHLQRERLQQMMWKFGYARVAEWWIDDVFRRQPWAGTDLHPYSSSPGHRLPR